MNPTPMTEPSSLRYPSPDIACIVCRSRKVKCDKAPSGCGRCLKLKIHCPGYANEKIPLTITRLKEDVDQVYRLSGLEKRKMGSCEECRTAKAKCNQARPCCGRCYTRRLLCHYNSGNRGRENRGSSPKLDAASSLLNLDAIEVENPGDGPTVTGLGVDPSSVTSMTENNNWLFSVELPDKNRVRILAEYYFTHIHPLRNLGFIHKPSFMQAIAHDTCITEYGEGVLYAICALGARFLTDGELGRVTWETIPGRQWGLRARGLAQMCSCNPGIQNLMLLLLYCEYGIRVGDNAFVFMLTGCCTRMVCLLRLDVEDGTCDDTNASLSSRTRREVRRRLLWSCFMLDSLVGAGVDDNLHWSTHPPSIALPCSDVDFLNQAPSTSQYLKDDLTDQWETNVHDAETRRRVCHIMYLRSQILRCIRNYVPQQEESSPAPWNEHSEFVRLLARLKAWRSQLPSLLTFDDMHLRIQTEHRNLGAFVHLHLAYHACVFDLTRVMLPGYDFPLAAGMSKAPVEFREMHQEMAFSHACHVSQILETGLQHGLQSIDDYYTAAAAFESIKIQVIYLTTRTADRSDLYDQVANNIRLNLRVLLLTHPHPDMPNVYLSAICPFLRRFGFQDVAALWEPFRNTVLPSPSDESGTGEVVGPADSAYLNQIATFRLARQEVFSDDLTRGDDVEGSEASAARVTPTWQLLPGEPTSPQRLSGGHPGEHHPPATFPDPMPAHPGTANVVLGTFPFTPEQYLRLAEEIGEYITWDARCSFVSEPWMDLSGI